MNIYIFFVIIIIIILVCGIIISLQYNRCKNNALRYIVSYNGGSDNFSETDKKYLIEYFNKEYDPEKIKKRIHNTLFNKKNFHNKKNIGDIVIDTFNVIHFIKKDDKIYLSANKICAIIEYIAIKLKKYFSGRIMFIIKDEETKLHDTTVNNEKYKELAKKLHIYIYIAESYKSNAPSWELPNWISKDIHSLKGRDDFAAIMISKEFNCPILSNDNYGDRSEFNYSVAPFKLLEYNWYSAKLPIISQYKPENYKTIKFVKTLLKIDNIFMPKELFVQDVISNN